MLQLWSRRSLASKLPFKLSRATAAGPTLLTHHPYQTNNGMSYSINTVLRINELLGHSPVTFLLDSGAAISVVHFDTLNANLRSQITTTRLTAPIGVNGSL